MVMVGHAQRLAQPLTRAQRRAILLAAVALVGLALWAVLRAGGGPVSAHGCVSVIVPSATGALTLHRCGAEARSWCRSEFAGNDAVAIRIQQQCRLAGLRPRG